MRCSTRCLRIKSLTCWTMNRSPSSCDWWRPWLPPHISTSKDSHWKSTKVIQTLRTCGQNRSKHVRQCEARGVGQKGPLPSAAPHKYLHCPPLIVIVYFSVVILTLIFCSIEKNEMRNSNTIDHEMRWTILEANLYSAHKNWVNYCQLIPCRHFPSR